MLISDLPRVQKLVRKREDLTEILKGLPPVGVVLHLTLSTGVTVAGKFAADYGTFETSVTEVTTILNGRITAIDNELRNIGVLPDPPPQKAYPVLESLAAPTYKSAVDPTE